MTALVRNISFVLILVYIYLTLINPAIEGRIFKDVHTMTEIVPHSIARYEIIHVFMISKVLAKKFVFTLLFWDSIMVAFTIYVILSHSLSPVTLIATQAYIRYPRLARPPSIEIDTRQSAVDVMMSDDMLRSAMAASLVVVMLDRYVRISTDAKLRVRWQGMFNKVKLF